MTKILKKRKYSTGIRKPIIYDNFSKSIIFNKLKLYEEKLSENPQIRLDEIDLQNAEPTDDLKIECRQTDDLKVKCEERMKNKHKRTLFIGFPQVLGSIKDVESLIPKVSIIRISGHRTNYIKSVLAEFDSKKRAEKNLEYLKDLKFALGKINVKILEDEPKIDAEREINKTRLLVSSISPSMTPAEVKNIFPKAISYKQSPNPCSKKRDHCEILASFNFRSEEETLEAFEMGEKLKIKGNKLLVIYDCKKEEPIAPKAPIIHSSYSSLDILKRYCLERINEQNGRSLYISFPTPMTSQKKIIKAIPLAQNVKITNRNIREKNINYAFLVFKSTDIAVSELKNISEEGKFKVRTLEPKTKLHYLPDPKKLILKNIPAKLTDQDIKNTLKLTGIKSYNKYERNDNNQCRKHSNFKTMVYLSYLKESTALADFRKGNCMIMGNQQVLVLFPPSEEKKLGNNSQNIGKQFKNNSQDKGKKLKTKKIQNGSHENEVEENKSKENTVQEVKKMKIDEIKSGNRAAREHSRLKKKKMITKKENGDVIMQD